MTKSAQAGTSISWCSACPTPASGSHLPRVSLTIHCAISTPFGLVQIGEELSRSTATSHWFLNLTLKMPGHLPPCTHISISHNLSPKSIAYNVLCPSQSPLKHLSCLFPGPFAPISKPIPPCATIQMLRLSPWSQLQNFIRFFLPIRV